MDNTKLTLNNNTLEYTKEKNKIPISINLYKLIIISIIICISIFIFFLDYVDHKFIRNIRYFVRIKKNFNNISSYINEKTAIEIEKTKRLYNSSSSQIKLNKFACYDLKTYYVAAKINKEVYLPEFITRGDGNIWKILKSSERDIPAQQFCEYILTKEYDNTVICGKDMVEKFGSSDYIITDSPCNVILTFMK